MPTIGLLSLLRTYAFSWALCLHLGLSLIKTRKHVFFPLSLEFSTELLGYFSLFLITVKAIIVEGYVLVVVIVLALASNLSSFVLGVGLGGILHRLLSSALTLNNVVWINVTVRALIRLGLRLFLGFLLLWISFWVGLLLIFEVQLLLF